MRLSRLSRAWIKRFKDYRSALNPPVVRNVCQRDKYPPHKYYFLSRERKREKESEKGLHRDTRLYGGAVSFSFLGFPFFFYSLAASRSAGRRRRVPRAPSRRIWKNRMRPRGRRFKDSFLPRRAEQTPSSEFCFPADESSG